MWERKPLLNGAGPVATMGKEHGGGTAMGAGLAWPLCLPTPSGQASPWASKLPWEFLPVLSACGGDCFEQHRLWSSLSPMQHLHVLEASSSQQQPAGPCFHPSVAEEEGRGKVASLCGSAARWRPALTSCPSSFLFSFFFFQVGTEYSSTLGRAVLWMLLPCK